MLVECGCCGAKTTGQREYQGGKGSVFDFMHSLLIETLLQGFVLSVCGSQGGVSIRGSIWVEHPYVKKGFLIATTPKHVCHDVKSSTILLIR